MAQSKLYPEYRARPGSAEVRILRDTDVMEIWQAVANARWKFDETFAQEDLAWHSANWNDPEWRNELRTFRDGRE